ncbi:GNAT family N-acetyltransferase [Sphingomonas cannabina]|uniref:GNAT family N-acetyltransferase n=1 Tax=Sphingomonas cannabina TaxID=2899123 RepID=UPI001F182B6C|nr:GNAT family protein [Sphingomonas cannabina]UIJ43795.1 GNAT family N-acetyltransferase [Sphingomonas cannabina]
MIVEGEEVARFVSERLGFGLCPPYAALGVVRDGEIAGGVVFNHFEGADVHVSVAGCGWTRAFLRAVGTYVYDKLGCERMTAITADEVVATFAERLGGQYEGRLRSHFGPGKDAFVMGILRDEWKY